MLGLVSNSLTFPAQTQCPFCSGERLTVYQDNTTRGEWHYCFDCGHSGDMIELAAAVWKMPISETLLRLAHEGLAIPTKSLTDDAVETYIGGHVALRHRMLKLWRGAQQRLVTKPTAVINDIRRRLGINDTLSRERQIKGPALLFGSVSRADIAAAFFPNNESGVGAVKSLLPGRSWSDALVVPYFSTPDLVTAYMFVGRDAGKASRLFRYTPVNARARPSCREPGLAGLQVAMEHHASYVIAMEDPLLMLRLQMRNFNSSLNPLPLVAWRADERGRTFDAWATLNGKKLIFWAMQPTPELLMQCYTTDGYLTLMGPNSLDRKSVSHYIRDHQPADLLRKIHSKSVPWREAISAWMSRASEDAIAHLLSRTLLLHEPLAVELRACARLVHVAPQHQLLLRRIKLGSREVLERGDCWFELKRGTETRILNATIRITHIVRHPDVSVYQGYISQRRCLTHFTISAEVDTQSGVIEAILKFAKERQIKLIGTPQPKWLYSVATTFHEPEVTKSLPVGWDGTKFVFQNLQIHNGGQTTKNNAALMPVDCPGTKLHHDFKLSHQMATKLTMPHPEAEVVWALAVSLLASILGQATNRDVPTTILSGVGLKTSYATILERLGVNLKYLSRSVQPPHVANTPKWPNNWPLGVRIDTNVNVGSLHRWLLETEMQGMCSFIDKAVARVLLMHGGFQVVDFNGLLRPKLLALLPLEYIIPSYLQFATKFRMAFAPCDSSCETWWETVLHSVAAWMTEHGGNPEVVLAARQHVSLDTDDQLAERAAASLYHKGALRLEPVRSRGGLARYVLVKYDADGLVLTREQLLHCCQLTNILPPPPAACPEVIRVPRRMISPLTSGLPNP